MAAPTDPHMPPLSGPPRAPVWELLFLALPTIAQMASYTVEQFIDTYMLSHVGDVEATAAGQAGLAAWSFMAFGVGIMFVVNALVSQAAGRRDEAECGRYLWQGIWCGLFFGLLMLPITLIGQPLFGRSGHPALLAALETTFFQITLSFAAMKLVAMAMGQFLLAVQKPNLVLLAAISGVVCNAGFNFCFIYGQFGFPRLGVAGAAWGTNLGVTVEAAILAIVIARTGIGRRYHCGDWKPHWEKLRTLLRIGMPSGLQIAAEIVAWTLFSVWVIGQFRSADLMAANAYTFRYMSVSFMPAFGLSTAVTALVGRYIGMGKPEIAIQRAHLGFKVAATYMVACGLFFFFAKRWLMGVFTRDPAVIEAGAVLLTFAGIYQFFDAMYIIYNGGLRGAGDTFVPAWVITILCWSIVVGGGFAIAHYAPQLGVAGPWFAAASYGIIAGIFLMTRFTRGGWKTIRLERGEPSANVPDANAAPVPA